MDGRESDFIKQLLALAQAGDLDSFRKTAQKANLDPAFSWNKCCYPKSGDTSVHVACRYGKDSILRLLREEVQNVSFEQANHDGKRPIHEAAQTGQAPCLAYLISQGVEVDCLKKADWTPMMLACTKDNVQVVSLLAHAGSKLDLRNKDGWTAFHIASRQGNAEMVSFLLNFNATAWKTVSKNGRTPLHTAALHGNADVVRLLINKAGYEPDEMDSCGSTPLMDALRGGHLDIVDILVTDHNANVHARDRLGQQSLHLAAQAGSCESVEYLINNWQINCNAESFGGLTPLHFACKEGQTEVTQLLLIHGANPNFKDDKSRTALDMAAAGQHTNCVKLLLRNGAVDSANENKVT